MQRVPVSIRWMLVVSIGSSETQCTPTEALLVRIPTPSPMSLCRAQYEGISRMQTSLRRYVSLTPAHSTYHCTPKLRKRASKMELSAGVILPGAVVATTEFGDWAHCPGLETELWVSSTGFVWQKDVRRNVWCSPSKNRPNPITGDVFVGHRGKDLRVHRLMALSFFGPPPSPSHTVDHLTKYDGDLVAERSDNRIDNLRWASKSEQSLNRNKQKPRRDGRPVLLWKVGAARSTALSFDSSLQAAKTLGLNAGTVSRVANGEKQVQTKGWHVAFAPTTEPRRVADDEEFRHINGNYVSQYGRALDSQTKAFAFTPTRNKGLQYANLSLGDGAGGSKSRAFHILVAEAWPDVVGMKPDESLYGHHTVHHINQDADDNRAVNLRWATDSEQSLYTTLTQPVVQKSATPVELRAPGSSIWKKFDTQCDAVKKTNALFGTKITQTTVSDSLKMNPAGRTINKGRHRGWSIRAAI